MLNQRLRPPIHHPPRHVGKPVLRLTQQQHRLTLSTRQINNVLIRSKERQPELVSSNQSRPTNLTGLQRQRTMLQSLHLGLPQPEQNAPLSRMSYIPVMLQEILFATNTPTPLRLLAKLTEARHYASGRNAGTLPTATSKESYKTPTPSKHAHRDVANPSCTASTRQTSTRTTTVTSDPNPKP